MPFKTKKKKQAASSRHIINYSSSATLSYTPGHEKLNHQLETGKQPTVKSMPSIENDYNFVKSELLKIVLLASMIIGLQLALKFSNLPIFK